ncbi:MAG: hypothetical protein ACR2PI_17460, partial [Hyphomicrobiaceae bacterium]
LFSSPPPPGPKKASPPPAQGFARRMSFVAGDVTDANNANAAIHTNPPDVVLLDGHGSGDNGQSMSSKRNFTIGNRDSGQAIGCGSSSDENSLFE